MRRPRFAAVIAAAALACLPAAVSFLASSCSFPSQPVQSPKTSLAQTTLPVNSRSPVPAITAIAQAIPTAKPSPNPLRLPTATPEPTARPANAPLNAEDYYVIRKNGLAFVVDKNGKTVLKPGFFEVSVLVAGEKVFFFGVPSQVDAQNTKLLKTGYLYSADGKKVSSERFGYAYGIDDSLIAVSNLVSEGDPGGLYDAPASIGVINTSGKLIIPYRYYSVYALGDTIAALRHGMDGISFCLDFFDYDGSPKGSMPVDLGLNDYVEQTGNSLVVHGAKSGVLNNNLQWVIPADWDSISYDEHTGKFLLTKNDLIGFAEKSGKMIVPVEYRMDSIAGSWDERYYLLRRLDGLYLFDGNGKQVFYSNQYDKLDCSNGIIIGHSKDGCDIYDFTGRFLLSIQDNVNYYYPEQKLFSSEKGIYDAEGKRLPLPNAGYINCLTNDRFIVYMENGLSGLCNAKGEWILKPDYSNLTLFGDRTLVYSQPCNANPYTENTVVFGLADIDGHILTGPEFYEFDQYSGGLAIVRTKSLYGLMDKNLKWVWSTTIYDDLQD